MVIKQMKIALEDIWANKASSLIFFIQILLCFLIGGFGVSEVESLNKLTQQLGTVGDISSVYRIIDVTDLTVDSALSESPDLRQRLYKLHEHIRQTDSYDAVRFQQTICQISDSRLDSRLAVQKWQEMQGYNMLYADTEYLKLYGVTCSEGELYGNESVSDGDIIPVVAGADYRKSFSLGDVLENKYRIVGFAEDSSFIINPNASRKLCYLDDYLIRPFAHITESSDSMDIYTSVVSSLIIAHSPEAAADIPNYSLELGLYAFSMRSYGAQMENIKTDVANELAVIGVFAVLILAVCIVCMYTVLLMFVNKHLREFTVHIMCGCTLSGILQRISFHVLLPMVLSYVISAVVFRSWAVTIGGGFFLVLLSIITLLPPLLKIYKNSLISIIGRTE